MSLSRSYTQLQEAGKFEINIGLCKGTRVLGSRINLLTMESV